MSDEQWNDQIRRACPNRIGEAIFIPDWAIWSMATGYLLYGSRRQLLISVGEDGWVSLSDCDRLVPEDFSVALRSDEDRPTLQKWMRRLGVLFRRTPTPSSAA